MGEFNVEILIDGLIWFACLIPIVSLHEFGHAWMADRCGDGTARMLGRVTINPSAHMDPIGTVLVPGIIILFGATGWSDLGGLLIGWGKPVPVNVANLGRRRDDILVSLAGPAMNIILALAALGLMRLAVEFSVHPLEEGFGRLALLSLFLCFLNLLPIPPLDGSQVLKRLIGMREEHYAQIAQYGIFILIIAVNTPVVGAILSDLTSWSFLALKGMFGF